MRINVVLNMPVVFLNNYHVLAIHLQCNNIRQYMNHNHALYIYLGTPRISNCKHLSFSLLYTPVYHTVVVLISFTVKFLLVFITRYALSI